MKSTQQERCLEVLPRLGMSPDNVRKAFNFIFAPQRQSRKQTGDELTWDILIKDIRLAINGIATNRTKWKAPYREAYEEYLAILRQTKADIESARRSVMVVDPSNPDGPRLPATVHDVHAIAVKRNKKLGLDGPTCTASWQTWIDPSVRAALTLRFARIHQLELGGKGTPPRPFMGDNIKRNAKDMLARHRTMIKYNRERMADGATTHPTSTTYYGAVHLAALRQFELALERWETSFTLNQMIALTDPLPVNWHAMLEPAMRERLRRAEKDPGDIDTQGITSFYCERPATHAYDTPEDIAETKGEPTAPASTDADWD